MRADVVVALHRHQVAAAVDHRGNRRAAVGMAGGQGGVEQLVGQCQRNILALLDLGRGGEGVGGAQGQGRQRQPGGTNGHGLLLQGAPGSEWRPWCLRPTVKPIAGGLPICNGRKPGIGLAYAGLWGRQRCAFWWWKTS
ncbi:hypothetical protein D3C78_1240780 [compost metagenome]